jgi:predicted ArsR family transcriptional regulator
VPDLAEAAGVHENTVRAHVAALEAGGLVAGGPRPAAGPGRPGVDYRLTAAELRAVGQEWGRYLMGRPGSYDVVDRVPQVLRRLGFEAEVVDDRVKLSSCPCPLVAADRPELVCDLVTGVLDGVLGAAGSAQAIGEERHDPAERRCELTLVHVGAPRRT